ncbi:hypothetical protein ACFFJB_08145 [Camelimonas abortus]|uniref:Uncharacterized protein n=1 Tax=Camelimonas abortus TaxID=1017184 RepID=A0ABV7LEU6_9HYPH
MGTVVQFRPRRRPEPIVTAEDDDSIDLITALDVAIRDLRDIAGMCERPEAREQAHACLTMLERAYAEVALVW